MEMFVILQVGFIVYHKLHKIKTKNIHISLGISRGSMNVWSGISVIVKSELIGGNFNVVRYRGEFQHHGNYIWSHTNEVLV